MPLTIPAVLSAESFISLMLFTESWMELIPFSRMVEVTSFARSEDCFAESLTSLTLAVISVADASVLLTAFLECSMFSFIALIEAKLSSMEEEVSSINEAKEAVFLATSFTVAFISRSVVNVPSADSCRCFTASVISPVVVFISRTEVVISAESTTCFSEPSVNLFMPVTKPLTESFTFFRESLT